MRLRRRLDLVLSGLVLLMALAGYGYALHRAHVLGQLVAWWRG